MQRTRPFRLKLFLRIVFSLCIIGLCILLDQLTKNYFKTNFERGEESFIIPNFFYFTYTVNTGAAWSFLADKSWSQLFFKILTAITLVLFIAMLVYSIVKDNKLSFVSLSLIIGGTLGNYIDRLKFNGVTDFIGLLFGNYRFPIFNLADSFLVIGIILFIIYLCFFDKNAILKRSNKSRSDKISQEENDNKSI